MCVWHVQEAFPHRETHQAGASEHIKVTTAAAVLHNIALDWQDDVPEDDHPGLGPELAPQIVRQPLPELDYADNRNYVNDEKGSSSCETITGSCTSFLHYNVCSRSPIFMEKTSWSYSNADLGKQI